MKKYLTKYSMIISTHIKPHLSGIAQFGFVLANEFHVPFISFNKLENIQNGKSVFLNVSFNIPDIKTETQVWRFLEIFQEKKITFSVFFHSFNNLPIEHALINKAAHIFSGNDEIYHDLKPFHVSVKKMWSPPFIKNNFINKPNVLKIFSFGMAFKIQTSYHRLFASKMKELRKNYIIGISTGFHEKANFGNYENIANELEKVYENKIHFYGFLSDEAISYFIKHTDLYINFFPKGARANNTTLYTVMNHSCPIITNLDQYSPPWLKSGINIIDIRDLNEKVLDKKTLRYIGKQSYKDVKKYTNWDIFIKEIINV